VKTLTRALTCLPPGLAIAFLAASCTIPSQARPGDRNPLAPDPLQRQPVSYYEAQLVELPLRVRSYDLSGRDRRIPIVVREMHVVHDDVRDEILVIDSDNNRNHMWSIDAYDFTLHWRTPIEKRVDFTPLPTRNYIFLMNNDGEYQAYDRQSSPRQGESRLVSKGRFAGDTFPSAHPASNDTHLFVPATNSNSVRGLSMIGNARGVGPESWAFPPAGTGGVGGNTFMQINIQPAADRETVVFVNNNHRLYMVDAQTGEYRADPYLEAQSRTRPTIADDLVFVGSDRGVLYAWQKSGQSAWIADIENGVPYGDIFVEDRWVFVRTLEVYDREVPTDDGRGKRIRADVRPGKLMAFQYRLIDVKDDRPVYDLVDGNPATPHVKEPMWTEPDVGQQVLMVADGRVYILYEKNEEFLSEREKAKLRDQGRIVTKRDELRTVSRTLKVLDVNTGRLARPEWQLNLMDFAFVCGSMKTRDRAIYLATRDGYVFKVYAGKPRSTAGGK
jgi:outer membrane protein assembly factor BamB